MEWEIFDPKGASYMRAISRRRELLLGDTRWSELDQESRQRLTGMASQPWGLLGRIRSGWPVVLRNEARIRAILDKVGEAPDNCFPDIAVAAMQEMQELETFKGVGWMAQTLVLALARPDRLLPLSPKSSKALGELSGKAPTTLGQPENYRRLLEWLYVQPWYRDGPPADTELERIWQFRAALVDAFVYETDLAPGRAAPGRAVGVDHARRE